eukprot:scaffold6411_cov152-Isochrysis_galbana.AAC.1
MDGRCGPSSAGCRCSGSRCSGARRRRRTACPSARQAGREESVPSRGRASQPAPTMKGGPSTGRASQPAPMRKQPGIGCEEGLEEGVVVNAGVGESSSQHQRRGQQEQIRCECVGCECGRRERGAVKTRPAPAAPRSRAARTRRLVPPARAPRAGTRSRLPPSPAAPAP